MTTANASLHELVSILAAARYGSRVVARRALRDLWPDAATRDEGIARVRALDPESADALVAVDAEGV
jgi:hypothetical protein